MKIDVVSMNVQYRGMDRGIDTSDFRKLKGKELDKVIDRYLEYIDDTLNIEGEKLFYKLLSFYDFLKLHNVNCEIIVYDNKPIDNAFGMKVEFLGFDITSELAESLIEEVDKDLQELLNDNNLIERIENVDYAISRLNTGGNTWEPCWVYRVLIPGDQ